MKSQENLEIMKIYKMAANRDQLDVSLQDSVLIRRNSLPNLRPLKSMEIHKTVRNRMKTHEAHENRGNL